MVSGNRNVSLRYHALIVPPPLEKSVLPRGHDPGCAVASTDSTAVSYDSIGDYRVAPVPGMNAMMRFRNVKKVEWTLGTRERTVLKHLYWRSGKSSVREIDRADVADLIESMAQADHAKTAKNYLSVITRLYRRLGLPSVTEGIPSPRFQVPPPECLTPGEIATCLRVAEDAGIGVEVAVALGTGLRRAELARLEWNDIDAPARCLVVRISKNLEARIVPLNAPTLAALARQRKITGHLRFVFPARQTGSWGWRWADRRRSDWTWSNALAPVQEAVPRFRLHGAGKVSSGYHLFRHTFITRCLEAGIPIEKVADWVGHRDLNQTRRYAKLLRRYDPQIEKIMP